MASPFKSYAQGPGIEPGNKVTDPCEFTIFAVLPNGQRKTTGGDQFEVHVEDPNFDQCKVTLTDNRDGTWKCVYYPTDAGKYHVDVILRNPSLPTIYDHVKNSPVDVMVDPGTVAENCIAYGPGLEAGNLDTDPAHFTIEARDKNGQRRKEGGDPFVVEVMGPTGPIPCDVVDNGDGTYAVAYNPTDAGRHDIAVTLEGKPIKGSTFRVDVNAGSWAGKSVMDTFHFVVRAYDKRGKPLTVGGAKIKAAVTKPNGQPCEHTKIEDNKNGTYTITYKASETGNFKIGVQIAGHEICGSPFTQKIA